MIFRIPAAAELHLCALAQRCQTPSPSQDCQPKGWPWDTRNTQAPLAKIDIRCENQQKHLNLNYQRMTWFDSKPGVEARSGHGCLQDMSWQSDAADPSAVAARWAATSVPEKKQTKADVVKF